MSCVRASGPLLLGRPPLFTAAGLGLCATLIAPEDGIALQTTAGWSCGQLQDHEGELQTPLAVRSGLTRPEAAEATNGAEAAEAGATAAAAAELVPSAAQGGGSLPREDFAELVLQYALRCSRSAAEGAPALRVVRVAPARESGQLTERAVVNYESVIGGPKTRARLGTAQSADWGELLAPFGVVRLGASGSVSLALA